MGTRLAFPTTKNNSVEIAYISYKNLRSTLDKSPEKIDGKVLVPSPNVKACDFLKFLEYFLSETLYDKLPGRSMKKATSRKNATELPG